MENQPSSKAMTGSEFVSALSIATPEDHKEWTVRAASILLTLSSSGADGGLDAETVMYVIQRLALTMPSEYRIAGTIAMLIAADEVNGQEEA